MSRHATMLVVAGVTLAVAISISALPGAVKAASPGPASGDSSVVVGSTQQRPTGLNNQAAGWLADPLTVPAASVPQWAYAEARSAVTTPSTDPAFGQDVQNTAIRIYQFCMRINARCHPATVAEATGATPGAQTTQASIMPDSVNPGTPYYGTSATALWIMTNQTPANPDANTTDLIEPYVTPQHNYSNYCGPGASRVLAYSWDGLYGQTANSFSWYAANIPGFTDGAGTLQNVDLTYAINADIRAKVGNPSLNAYGVSSSKDGAMTTLQSHIGIDVHDKGEPMIVDGQARLFPSWPSTYNSSVYHIVSIWQYDWTNGRSNVTYDETGNVAYNGDTKDGPIPTTIDVVWNAMTSGGSTRADKDVW